MRWMTCLLSLFLSCGWLAAQSVKTTLPYGLETIDGNDDWLAGAQYAPARILALYSKRATGLRGGERIVALRTRLDDPEPKGWKPYAPNGNLTVAVRLSTRGVDPAKTPTQNWSKHEGAVKGPWSPKLKLNLPGSSPASPEPWVPLPLAAPFLVDKDGTLAVDVKFYAPRTVSAWSRLDGQNMSALGSYNPYGKGCPSRFTVMANGFYPGSPEAWTAGYSQSAGDRQVAWAGKFHFQARLPFTFGGQPCYLLASPTLLHPAVVTSTGSTGRAKFVWMNAAQLKNPALVGATFFVQHGAVTPNLALKAAKAVRVVIGYRNIAGRPTMSLYGYAKGRKPFNPDFSMPQLWSVRVPVFQLVQG